MAKYQVEYEVSLSAVREIEADSFEDAMRLADELRFDEEYHQGLIDSFDNDYEGYRSKYIKFTVDGEIEE